MWWSIVALGAPQSAISASLPATGRQEMVFTLPEFGRYAVTAKSSQGVAIEVVDRMAGVLDQAGAAGSQDGRVDLFLDRGEVKVVSEADPAGTGMVTLQASPFRVAAPPLRLEPERRIESTLGDLQTRSWWVDVPEGGPVSLLAAGRYLADLRLWRDGVWLVDAAPSCTAIAPVAGAPWKRCGVTASVEPGVYLASVYGGPGAAWTTDDSSAPLELQWGVPKLGRAGQLVSTLPASGFVRWQVPDGVDTVHVALPDIAAFRITGPVSGTAQITSESRRPTATARLTGSGYRTVLLSGVPGQSYTLSWLSREETLSPPKAGTFWVGSLSTSDPADVLELTGMVTDPGPGQNTVVRSATQALPASSATAVSRVFNLTGPTSTLIEVAEAGPYVLWVEGLAARLDLEPFLLMKTAAADQRYSARGELHVELNAGLYAFRMVPENSGVATLGIAYDSLAARAKRVVGAGVAPAVLRPVFQIPSIALTPASRVALAAPPGTSGLFLRELPIDPVEALPITLLPAESIDVPVRIREPGTLTFRAPDGTPLPLALDGRPAANAVEAVLGEHVVRVFNGSTVVRTGSLQLAPARLRTDAPLPALDAARLATLDAFPRLRAGKPLGVDLVDDLSRTVRLMVDQPGLYVVESTGLLETRGAVRTRTLPALMEATSNGAGRNFQIARFLRSGDYQLTAEAVAPSSGHAGLEIRAGVIKDGGAIQDETPARVTLAPTEAVRHTLRVAQAGRYAVRHAGRTGVFDCRLEDLDGWSVTGVPEQRCELDLWLDAGEYVLLGLPDPVESRRTTTVRAIDEAPLQRTGHGPFALALNTSAEAIWAEPRGDGERPADVWELTLPVAVHATVTLSPEMAGEVRAGDQQIARLVPGEAWSGQLARGLVQLQVRGARRGTGVPYAIRLDVAELVAGSAQEVDAEGAREVVVAEPGVYTLESDGGADVRARLLDAAGQVVGANDDRPDDWNFRISARLDPGRYRLVLDSVAASDDGGGVVVSMRSPRELDSGALEAGKPRTLQPGHDALLLAVTDARPEVVVATADSSENAGIAIEVSTPQGWRGLAVGTGRAAVAVARVDGSPVRVRVWSEDGRGGDVTVGVESLHSRSAGDGALAGGVSLGNGWGAVRSSGGAGQFAVLGEPFLCGTARAGCAPAREGLTAAPAEGLVLVQQGGEVVARRVELEDGQLARLKLLATLQRLDLAESGPVAVELRAASGLVAARVTGTEAPILVAGSSALAIGIHGGRAVDFWGDGDATAVVHRLAVPRVESGSDRVHAFSVPAGGAVTIAVPESRNLAVDLEAGLAVLSGDGRGAWAEQGTTRVHLRAAVGPVTVVNPTANERLARVEVTPSAGSAALLAGSPHEDIHAAAETWVLPVPASEGALHVRGHATATFVRSDGQVSRNGPFDVGPGGMLTLAVTPGPVLAWVELPGSPGPTREVAASPAQTITGEATLRLPVDSLTLALRPAVPAAMSLRAPCPLVARIEVPGGWSRTEVLDAGDRVDVWIPDAATGATVALRSLAGATLFGELAIAESVPLLLGEGAGPETLLSAGGSAWFSLEVTRAGLVGFGARATAERVDAVLMDLAGRVLGRGVVLSKELEPGRYLLSLSQPVGSAPVRARPVVVGLVAPPEGPPEDVIRGYLPSVSRKP